MSISSESERWFQQAEHDLANARSTFDIGVYDVSVFLCQQAVEKALKALMVRQTGSPPQRTHSIQQLAGAVGLGSKIPSESLVLDDYYVASRYPDATIGLPYEMIGTNEAEEAIRVASDSMEMIRKELFGDGQETDADPG